ncbi:5-oxoprolinase subunit PxpA [Leifsonia shinshuensis]|uniref:5-oxoprolinase subunit PxpA n=1 Tax=Leifsonia shinshuensis TaxID=150026 RepID=A0A7G6YA42_9MICO|nr:5-oxoprolinase subunit PxpA [Leifsonia shinshuensis]QNE35357.1 5-oxoprolinase subunit PxpA [Leifsonia shinshuensis]
MTPSNITINSDLGEAIGLHSFGNDEGLLAIVDTVNVACGFHAGDPGTMQRTVRAARAAGVTIGAHPGLPDVAGFGRRAMALTPAEARDLVRYQVGALVGFLDAQDVPLDHIKPHGALFGMAAADEALMLAICEVAVQYSVPIFGLAGTAHETACASAGVEFVPELYVDLDYRDDGMIIVEREPRARPLEAVRRRVEDAVGRGHVVSLSGSTVPVHPRSICVHSDLPTAVDVAREVRRVLSQRPSADGVHANAGSARS